MNTNRANQVRGHFTYLAQRDQQGIITKHQIYRQVILKETFSLMQPSQLPKISNILRAKRIKRSGDKEITSDKCQKSA